MIMFESPIRDEPLVNLKQLPAHLLMKLETLTPRPLHDVNLTAEDDRLEELNTGQPFFGGSEWDMCHHKHSEIGRLRVVINYV